MSDWKQIQQAQDTLNQIKTALGVHHPVASRLYRANLSASGDVSLESVANEIKHKSAINVEIFDEHIRELVNNFYLFSDVYREDHAQRFVEDIKQIENLLKESNQPFVDKIRWSDDRQYIDSIRQPVSFAYLNLFGQTTGLKVVVPDDFWKCLDLPQLGKELHLTNSFKKIATLFTLQYSADTITKLLQLILGLRSAIVNLSNDYERVIEAVVNSLNRGETQAPSERINYDLNQVTVSGVVLKPLITNVINEQWYQKNLNCSIGSMVGDVHLLLQDPAELCTPNNSDTAMDVQYLFDLAKNPDVVTNLKTMQREFINVVEQIDLSSRRLVKIMDKVKDIPDKQNDGNYNHALKDTVVLITVYSGTLNEILLFTVEIAKLIEDSFSQVHHLKDGVVSLKIAIDTYIAKRLKNG